MGEPVMFRVARAIEQLAPPPRTISLSTARSPS
jgi:hypothetical protein